ncbi:LysR family transcriptional regulator [Ancylobacter sp. MQZ15Z-1]|uniref:LysR family transcriptional regulator n=1 Tax=Ancylobacter mangrovi TaxID=2972472 RepID=A0A9X2PLK0_9HYPH|nr:LysR family transcriptional regulator [Ancylobacter mangrovi]MCS0497297.1 LysR family transcriptional regulator [Ancylobacter mangrovi]
MLHSRLIRYIDEVARAGSIRQAAEKLNVASTAINRQIIAFEEELGLPIFERLPRGVRLTTAGEILVEHIRNTMKDHSRAMLRIGDVKTLRRTKITVATLEALTADVLAHVVSEFQQTYPLTKIIVRAMPADAIVTVVAGGDADFGVGFDFPSETGLTVHARVSCSLGAVVRPSHPLATRASVRLSNCLDYPFVLPAEDLTLRQLFDRMARKARVSIEPLMETNSIDLLKRNVMLADVVTVLTRADVELERLRGGLAFVPFRDSDVGAQTLTIVHRNSARFDAVTMHFAEKLAELAHQIGD